VLCSRRPFLPPSLPRSIVCNKCECIFLFPSSSSPHHKSASHLLTLPPSLPLSPPPQDEPGAISGVLDVLEEHKASRRKRGREGGRKEGVAFVCARGKAKFVF